MRRALLLSVALVALPLWLAPASQASEVGYPLQEMTPNMRDLPSLQRGARVFFKSSAVFS